MAMNNEYVDIPNFIGLYKINKSGQIMSYDRIVKMPNGGFKTISGKHISQHENKRGYLKVMLTNSSGIRKGYFVHRLVMKSFVGESALQVNHLDENKKNNNLDNLEYCTYEYNNNYGSHNIKVGISHKKAIRQLSLDGSLIKR